MPRKKKEQTLLHVSNPIEMVVVDDEEEDPPPSPGPHSKYMNPAAAAAAGGGGGGKGGNGESEKESKLRLKRLTGEKQKKEQEAKDLESQIRELEAGMAGESEPQRRERRLACAARALYVLNAACLSAGGCYGTWWYRRLRAVCQPAGGADTTSALIAVADVMVVVAVGILPACASAVGLLAIAGRRWTHLIFAELLNLCVIFALAGVITYSALLAIDMSDPIASIGSRTFSSPERRIEAWRSTDCQKKLAPSQCHDDYEAALSLHLRPDQIEVAFGNCRWSIKRRPPPPTTQFVGHHSITTDR